MNGFTEPLPGLLDDPHIQSTDLPTLTDFHIDIAPLRNPAPSRNSNVPSPLEPLTDNAAPARVKARDAQTQDPQPRRTPKISPSDVILARDAKKPNLTIRELVEASSATQFEPTYLPSFVSLAVVERSPVQRSLALDSERAQKRLRLDNTAENGSAEDYRRLPRPDQNDVKNNARPLPLLPAMVTGLHEPPLSAALLPSMTPEGLSKTNSDRSGVAKMKVKTVLAATGSKSHGLPPELMLNSPEIDNATLPPPDDLPIFELRGSEASFSERTPAKTEAEQKSSRRVPRKWTDLETEQLMTGVRRYGIGKWKQILNDPGFTFYGRTTIDLKDRFRVCQPEEYKNRKSSRSKKADLPLSQASPSAMNIKPGASVKTDAKFSTLEQGSEDVHAADDSLQETEEPQAESPAGDHDANGANTSPPSSTHTGKRRKRRPWSNDEDDKLMKGVAKHGFQWTAIHDDGELGLSHRRATDLRDRIRNKFPDGYKHAETAPLRSERRKESIAKAEGDQPKQSLADGTPLKEPTKREKLLQKESAKLAQGATESSSQEHSGLKLPPLALDEGDWDWGNTTLPPLLDWEEIGI